MLFEQIYLGCLAQASYLIGSDGEAAIVDPSRDVDHYIRKAADKGLRIRYVVETHLHADFVSGHLELAERTGAEIVIGARAGATSVTVRGAVLPGISLTGRVTGSAFDLLDSPVEAQWTFGALARGTATTAALRTDGVHVAGEARMRVEDVTASEWLAGVLAPVLRLAHDGEIDVTFRGAFGPEGPRLETLSARLELRG